MPSKEAVSAKLADLERGWVKNEGQWDERALFSAPGYFGTTWIAKDGELLHVAVKGKESWVISERWVGGKVRTITPEEELPTKVSYFIGNDPSKHRSNLPTYRYVSLGEVWSGIEVKLKATQKTVEKLFYVQPGADPSKIVVEVGGAKGLKLSKDGEIIIKTGLGELKLSKPIAWQEKDGRKLPVEVSYKLIGKNRYSFEVAKADPSLPIVIDPILASTFIGGGGDERGNALAIHPRTGEVYVAGNTRSTDFPGTSGGPQENNRGGTDAFVARLSADLRTLHQSTYLGGSNDDFANALAIHPTTGEVYVAGGTFSTDFPRTSGGAQASYGGGTSDAFVARLSADLRTLHQSTYLGGRGSDSARALTIHPTRGEVYVAGNTNSTDFPRTSGGAQASRGGGTDAFVARLRPDLGTDAILQATYLGGRGSDFAKALAICLMTDEVYVAGDTNSTDFPGTTGRDSTRTDQDAFVARLRLDLGTGAILQATYLGGSNNDGAKALAIHPTTGEVYVAGETNSTDFPGTSGGAQASNRGGQDAFVARLRLDLGTGAILQATYLGGSGSDDAKALAIHPTTGEVYVAGETASNDFPNTSGGAQATYGGGTSDVFVARLRPDLQTGAILQATYLGGSNSETMAGRPVDPARALAIHPTTGEVYVAGGTASSDFPGISSDAAQATYRGNTDVFVARLTADLAADSGSGGDGGSGGGTGGGDGGTGSGGGSGAVGGTGGGGSGGSDSGSGSGGSGTGGSDSGTGGGSGSGTGGGSGGISGGSGGGSGAVGRTGGGGGGGCSMTGSASSMAGLWNILVWLSVPALVLARRIRRK
jgi:hypothetical protein